MQRKLRINLKCRIFDVIIGDNDGLKVITVVANLIIINIY